MIHILLIDSSFLNRGIILVIPNKTQRKEVKIMARKVTSKRVARIASNVLRNKRQDKKSRIAAASALSQREKRKKSRK